MMPKFSKMSLARLKTCEADLQHLFEVVITKMDCAVVCGHRNAKQQNNAYYSNPRASQVKFPNSKHNPYPSKAIDVAPYPIDWKDTGAFYMFVGYVKAVADVLNIKIRCGADWDGDGSTSDQEFHDLVHFELVD